MLIVFIISALLLLFIIYSIVPTLISRLTGAGAVKSTGDDRTALTFDDGPDPKYTRKLMDLLDRYSIKATFYVVGCHAERHPEIIREMAGRGHEIAIHGQKHWMNWFLPPSVNKNLVNDTADLIERLTGARPVTYRPPWGMLNLGTYAAAGPHTIVLWSSMPGDWKAGQDQQKFTERVARGLKPGAIMVLHDCGRTFGADPEAPCRMVTVLEKVLEEKSRQLKFCKVSELLQVKQGKTY